MTSANPPSGSGGAGAEPPDRAPVARALGELAAERASACLVVERDGLQAHVWLRDGRVVSATAPDAPAASSHAAEPPPPDAAPTRRMVTDPDARRALSVLLSQPHDDEPATCRPADARWRSG